MVGGVTACIGAKMLGPRIGKYGKDGKPVRFPVQTLRPWLSSFSGSAGSGFQRRSQHRCHDSGDMVNASQIFLEHATWLLLLLPHRYDLYLDPLETRCFHVLKRFPSRSGGHHRRLRYGIRYRRLFIGLIAGIAIVLSVEFFDNKAKIDDPVGAISVHGVCGALGTILTGFFALDGGVFYGGGFHFLGVQILGVVSVIAWVLVSMNIIFRVIDKVIGLRVPADVEIDGLDYHESRSCQRLLRFSYITDSGNRHGSQRQHRSGRRAEYARASQKQREAAVSVTRTGDPSAAPANSACASIHHVAKHSRYDKLKNATQ